MLTTRDFFREYVFKRDNHKCVICGDTAKDAHHIIERRLWDNGGYYIDNGASLCAEHHLQAEQTVLSCNEIREAAGIKKIVLPEHFYEESGYQYDKWGNIVLPNNTRLKGELFFDISVQKILKTNIAIYKSFSNYVKYPRTYHLPWSETVSSDDKRLKDTKHFENKNVVITAKMDGEQTTCYHDYIHARSIDGRNHPSRAWVKNLHNKIAHEIPKGWRVCGENLYAKHTLHYKNLDNYFQVFSIWNELNICLSWDETIIWSGLLGLRIVPVLYTYKWDEEKIRNFKITTYNDDPCEGYVVRMCDSFPYNAFRYSVAKCVNKLFQNDLEIRHHWMHQQIITNEVNKNVM